MPWAGSAGGRPAFYRKPIEALYKNKDRTPNVEAING
jgi:hypothetical protein